ncbi:MAG: Cna B-type domain-containing protein [Lachnospiraceae bacterium]|jgi:hypothetical protein|nr:Cna B-type domain-containing protein [Lachnospiraceae bacterium]
MKRGIKSFISIILTMVMIIGIMPSSVSYGEDSFSDDNFSLYVNGISENADGTVHIDTGTEVTMYTGINLQGKEISLENSYEIITIPKTWLDTSFNNNRGIKISSAGDSNVLNGDPVITNNGDTYSIRCNYNKVSATFDLPFVFKIKNYTTLPNSTFTINAKLYDGNENCIGEKKVTITNIAKSIIMFQGDSNVSVYDSKREGDPSTTSDVLDENPTLNARIATAYNYGKTGNLYTPSKEKVVIKLAEGVVWASGSGSNSWTHDETTDTYYWLRTPSTGIYDCPHIYVKMPGVSYGVNHPAFTYYGVGIDSNGEEVSISKTTPKTVNGKIEKYVAPSYEYSVSAGISGASNYNYLSENENKITTWTLSTNNGSSWSHSDDTLNNTTSPRNVLIESIKDINLNSHSYFYNLKIDTTGSTLINLDELKINVLYGVDESGNKTKITDNIPLDTEFLIPDTYQNFRNISIEFPEKVVLAQGKHIVVRIGTKIFESDYETGNKENHNNVLGGTDELLNTNLNNSSSGTYYYDPEDSSDTSEKDFTKLSSHEQIVVGGKATYTQSLSGATTLTEDEYTQVHGQATYTGLPAEIDGKQVDFENGKVIMLLPNGYEYINDDDHETSISYKNTDGEIVTTAIDPEIQYDYKATGKRAIIFDIPSDRTLASSSANAVNTYLWLKTNKGTPIGNSAIESYLVYNNNGKYGFAPNPGVVDTKDLNDNGDIADKVAYKSTTVAYAAKHEIIGIQLVGKDLNSLTQTGTSASVLGDSFYYGMKLTNRLENDSVKEMSVINILPFANDKAIVSSSGEYKDRGSTYTPYMTGPVKVLKDGSLVSPEECGYTVLYSTETPTNGNIEENLNKSFTNSVADYSKVTMLKVNLKEETIFNPNDDITFVFPEKIPTDKNVKDGDIAFDSFAFATKTTSSATITSEDYIEAYKAGAPVVTYTISGNVYNDFNMDSFLSEDEKTISDIQVSLYNSEGEKVDTTTSGEDGKYSFNIINNGDYTVKVENLPDNLELSNLSTKVDDVFPVIDTSLEKQKIDNKNVDNDINSEGSSSTISISNDNRNPIVNISLKDKLVTIPVEQDWMGVENPPVESVDVSLNAMEQSDDIEITSEEEWKDEFIDIRNVDEDGNKISYTPKLETIIDGFTNSIITKPNGDIAFRSVSGETINVNVFASWIGEEQEYLNVNILNNGEIVDTKILNPEGSWQGVFQDLPKFDPSTGDLINYTVEPMTIPGYTSEVTGDMVNGFTIVNRKNPEAVQPPVDNSGQTVDNTQTIKQVEKPIVITKTVTKTVTKYITKEKKVTKSAKTGDSNNSMFFIIIAICACVCAFGIKKKK